MPGSNISPSLPKALQITDKMTVMNSPRTFITACNIYTKKYTPKNYITSNKVTCFDDVRMRMINSDFES